VITGFNTDIKHGGTTYHVQTEDKGLDSPLILSLVYVGGAIIASKRTRYEDLVSKGFDEKELTERLQRQHKLIIAAIKAGRIDDLKRMAGVNGAAAEQTPHGEAAAPAARKPAGQKRKKPEATAAPPVEAAKAPQAPAESKVPELALTSLEDPLSLPDEVAPPAPPAPPVAPEPARASAPAADDTPILVEPLPVEPLSVEEPEIVIIATLADELDAFRFAPPRPAPQAPPAAEPAPPARPHAPPATFTPAAVAEVHETPLELAREIYLTLLDDEGDFRAGQLATIKVYVGRGVYGRRPEPGASVTVKVLGTSFRPLILTATTDAQGVGVVRAMLPRFSSGRAAIIIRAVAGEESAEIRRIIHQ
jgi:hypothetical protein